MEKNVMNAAGQAPAKDQAAKIAEIKAKKAEAAKAWKQRKDEEKVARQENAKKLIKLLADKKVVLTPELDAFLNDIANPKKGGSTSSSGVLNQMFGATPKVGDKITLKQAFERTFKSAAEIKRLCKMWNEKGIVVKFTQNSNLLESTYTIEKLA